jgi:hypothetical protein
VVPVVLVIQTQSPELQPTIVRVVALVVSSTVPLEETPLVLVGPPMVLEVQALPPLQTVVEVVVVARAHQTTLVVPVALVL